MTGGKAKREIKQLHTDVIRLIRANHLSEEKKTKLRQRVTQKLKEEEHENGNGASGKEQRKN